MSILAGRELSLLLLTKRVGLYLLDVFDVTRNFSVPHTPSLTTLLQQALVFAKKHVDVLLQGGCPGAELALSKAKDDKKGSASKAEASPDVPAKPSKGAGKGGVDKYENAYSTVSDTDLANAYVALAEVERLVSCCES